MWIMTGFCGLLVLLLTVDSIGPIDLRRHRFKKIGAHCHEIWIADEADVVPGTADIVKAHNCSYPTSLYCISLSITASMAKNKQSADSKQTAELLKSCNFH